MKDQLPDLVAGSLLNPVMENTGNPSPLTTLITQVVDPAKGILNSAGSELPPEQVESFRNEVVAFQQELPRILSRELLAPLLQDSTQANQLNGLVNDISNQLSSLTDLLQQKIV